MNIASHLRNHAYCLEQAALLLGTSVRALALDWQVDQLLRKRIRLEARVGWSGGDPLLTFTSGPKGLELEFGLERYRLEIDGTVVPLAHVVAPGTARQVWKLYNFWAVPIEHYRRLYRFLRRQERRTVEVIPPVMRDADRRRLWENTVGFLRRGRDTLRKYGVPQKRGVLLLGEPGNGKTMACRWLFALCSRHGLRWQNVTAEDYLAARNNGSVRELFELDGPGIVLFDDLDQQVYDREERDTGIDRTTFLTELDGLHLREGIVYLFTSNAQLTGLDPAFRRPGRIDLFLRFPRPDAELRRRFVTERWHGDMVRHIDLETVVAATDGMSFAELDEVKKLLALRFLDTSCWNWDLAWSAFQASHALDKRSNRIGFGATPAHERTAVQTSV